VATNQLKSQCRECGTHIELDARGVLNLVQEPLGFGAGALKCYLVSESLGMQSQEQIYA